jgi:amyloid beta precursor protein binding protein 1
MTSISADQQKYDRQLRLWGSHGQESLQESSILMIGSNFTGCETLKNMVLPGIGSFTILDDHIVIPSDVGVNFFLCSEDIGASRAEKVANLIQELNPQVKHHFDIMVTLIN